MIRLKIIGMNGKTILRLIPETDEDEAELERLAEAGELDVRDSFADDPNAWESDENK